MKHLIIASLLVLMGGCTTVVSEEVVSPAINEITDWCHKHRGTVVVENDQFKKMTVTCTFRFPEGS